MSKAWRFWNALRKCSKRTPGKGGDCDNEMRNTHQTTTEAHETITLRRTGLSRSNPKSTRPESSERVWSTSAAGQIRPIGPISAKIGPDVGQMAANGWKSLPKRLKPLPQSSASNVRVTLERLPTSQCNGDRCVRSGSLPPPPPSPAVGVVVSILRLYQVVHCRPTTAHGPQMEAATARRLPPRPGPKRSPASCW